MAFQILIGKLHWAEPGLRSEVQVTRDCFTLDWRSSFGTGQYNRCYLAFLNVGQEKVIAIAYTENEYLYVYKVRSCPPMYSTVSYSTVAQDTVVEKAKHDKTANIGIKHGF